MSHINYVLVAIISVTSIDLVKCLLPNCGSLIIKCNSHQLAECCEGPCCPFLHQYEGHILNAITPDSKTITHDSVSTPCPKIGEECTSALSLVKQCCGGGTLLNGGTTSCKYTSVDSQGYEIGTCCVKNGQYGCNRDEDCCKIDGYCNNGKCQRNTNPLQSNVNILPQNVRVDTRQNDDVKVINVEQKNNKNKGINLISIVVIPITLLIILIILFCGIYYWYYKRYIKNNKHKWQIKQETEEIDVIGGSIMECDIQCGDSGDSIDSIDNIQNDIHSSTEC